MNIVGVDFRDGVLFVPEVLMSANAMKAGMALLKPLLAETGARPIGTVVVGTVKGDIHDIGKNLVTMMMTGAGYQVIDLGIDVDKDRFLEAIEKDRPDMIGLSALLTTTMLEMKEVVKIIRQTFANPPKIIIGGAPVTRKFAEEIQADGYGEDAVRAVELADQLII